MNVARRPRPARSAKAGPPPASDWGDLVRNRSEALLAILPAARRGDDADAIHDVRVASRRLGEAIALVSRGGADARTLSESVGDVRRAAGRLRDADVWIGWLEGAANVAKKDRAAIEALLSHERRRRKKAARRCHERLSRVDAKALERRLRGFAKDASARDGRDTAAETFRSLLLERDARAAKLAAAAAKSGDAEDLHEARIAYKQLRYAAESAESLFPAAIHRRLIAKLKGIQDVLGELHDRDVFLDRAARRGETIAEKARKSRRDELRNSFEALSARLARERKRLLARFRRLVPGRAEIAFAPTIRRGLKSRATPRGSRSRARTRAHGERPARSRIGAASTASRAEESGPQKTGGTDS